jgi:hypothetical protein
MTINHTVESYKESYKEALFDILDLFRRYKESDTFLKPGQHDLFKKIEGDVIDIIDQSGLKE